MYHTTGVKVAKAFSNVAQLIIWLCVDQLR
jgi:hypothetical protein